MDTGQLKNFSLQYISYPDISGDHLPGIIKVLEGGVKWIQLRMKDHSIEEIEHVAKQVKELCTAYKATFILNDHPKLVAKLDLEGVHIGKTDLPAVETRKIIGDHKILGRTCNTLQDLKEASILPIDYIGFGPYKHTQTKKNIDTVLGVDIFSNLKKWNKEYRLKPIVGIGGIDVEDIHQLTKFGLEGIAASGMFRHKNTKEIKNIVEDINHGFTKNRR